LTPTAKSVWGMDIFIRFIRSKSGRIFFLYLALAAAISAAVAGYFYRAGLETMIAQKAGEKATALRLLRVRKGCAGPGDFPRAFD
jgi:hypothetical protein